MQTVSTIGLDIAKWVFQVTALLRRASGGPPAVEASIRVGILPEAAAVPGRYRGACASSHHWSRELQTLGHTVRLMPPAYVKPYVKRHKNDAVDAEAICEAVTRPNMRFVATKTPEQQSGLVPLHRGFDWLIFSH